MEEEKPHAMEMGEEEAQAAQEKDEKAGRRTLASLLIPDFFDLFLAYHLFFRILLLINAQKHCCLNRISGIDGRYYKPKYT
jgi:hypothetical protein